jgi:hypothetical protein
MNRRIGQTILAIVVALSVAATPVAAGFTTGGKALAPSVSADVPDCEHHHGQPNDTTPKSTDGCDCMAGCALKCFTTTVVSFSSLSFSLSPSVALKPVRMENKVASRMGSPPFRPPRS